MESSAPFYTRPTVAHIDLAALSHNYRELCRFVAPAKVMPVIKANAYGHGLVGCGKALEAAGAPYLGVAYIEEAAELRAAGVSCPIHVFGGLLSSQVDQYLNLDADLTAPSVTKLETIDAAAAKYGKRARVHLKIDTGLERIGVHHYSAQALFDAALQPKRFVTNPGGRHNDPQPEAYRQALDEFFDQLPPPGTSHPQFTQINVSVSE